MNAIQQELGQRKCRAIAAFGARLLLAGRVAVGAFLFFLLFFLVPAAPALAAANESICCNDASGRYTCGDVMPPRCNGRMLKVYNQQGFLIRTIAPRMSEEEKRLADEKARQEQEERNRIRLQARKDRALLQTYDSVEGLDRMRERSEADVKIAIKNAQSLIDAAKKRKRALEDEVAATGQMSPEAASQVRNEETTIKAQSALLEIKKNELAQIRAKFAEDRNRYILLTTPEETGIAATP
ncbi:MAG: hypothetical protein LBC37_07225 [Zoogloeaceae bacterium]|nr:hypothetical protein [Zoogloeaceae bacterium]